MTVDAVTSRSSGQDAPPVVTGRHPARDRLADFSTDRRVLLLAGLASLIGGLAAVVAWALVWLIAVITNLAYYQRFSSHFASPAADL